MSSTQQKPVSDTPVTDEAYVNVTKFHYSTDHLRDVARRFECENRELSLKLKSAETAFQEINKLSSSLGDMEVNISKAWDRDLERVNEANERLIFCIRHGLSVRYSPQLGVSLAYKAGHDNPCGEGKDIFSAIDAARKAAS